MKAKKNTSETAPREILNYCASDVEVCGDSVKILNEKENIHIVYPFEKYMFFFSDRSEKRLEIFNKADRRWIKCGVYRLESDFRRNAIRMVFSAQREYEIKSGICEHSGAEEYVFGNKKRYVRDIIVVKTALFAMLSILTLILYLGAGIAVSAVCAFWLLLKLLKPGGNMFPEIIISNESIAIDGVSHNFSDIEEIIMTPPPSGDSTVYMNMRITKSDGSKHKCRIGYLSSVTRERLKTLDDYLLFCKRLHDIFIENPEKLVFLNPSPSVH